MADRTEQRQSAKDMLREQIYDCIAAAMTEGPLTIEDALGVLEGTKLGLWQSSEQSPRGDN